MSGSSGRCSAGPGPGCSLEVKTASGQDQAKDCSVAQSNGQPATPFHAPATEQSERNATEHDEIKPAAIAPEKEVPVSVPRLGSAPSLDTIESMADQPGSADYGRRHSNRKRRFLSGNSEIDISKLLSGQGAAAHSLKYEYDNHGSLPVQPLVLPPPASGALASLLPGLLDTGLLAGMPCSDSAGLEDSGSPERSSSFEFQEKALPGMDHGFGRKKRQARRRSGKQEDCDYEPWLKSQRPRKWKCSSGGVLKHKSPGRARLTLAGTASTISDVDPGWTVPHGSVVLVAKTLTKSDTLGRVILPRVAVETNMSFLTSYRAYSLAVRDLSDRPWEFVVKSWANGSEQRRVYVLEQASLFIKSNHLHEGDIIGICCDEVGNLRVAANTAQLREAVARPTYGITFSKPLSDPMPGKSIPLSMSQDGRCTRAPFCEKLPLHSGFCSGPRDRKHCCATSSAKAVPADSSHRASRSWSGSLDNAGDALKMVVSLPLTLEDIACGQAGLPTSVVKGDLAKWACEPLTVKDEAEGTWSLSLSSSASEETVVLGSLGGFYDQHAAGVGDCLTVSAQRDGSLLMQLDPSQEDRTSLTYRSSDSTMYTESNALDGALANEILRVKCGNLSGSFDLPQGLITVLSDTGEEAAVSPGTFQMSAGFEETEDWLDTICVEEAEHCTSLRRWLHQHGIHLEGRTYLPTGCPPKCRFRQQRSKSQSRGLRKPGAAKRGWMAPHLGLSSMSSRASANPEDSMAAEVLISLCEHNFRFRGSASALRLHLPHVNSEARSAAAEAAREAILAAENAMAV